MTTIEWTQIPGTKGETWNPTRGCSRVSPGCDNCYAMRQARRFDTPDGRYEGLTRIRKKGGVDWSGRVRLVPEMLEKPLRWRAPRTVFVNSMSDLFHPSLSNEQIASVFGVMAACPQHTFIVLTKRAKRMREWLEWLVRHAGGYNTTEVGALLHYAQGSCAHQTLRDTDAVLGRSWPLPNVWLGVSAEDQRRGDERIPELLRTPAAIRLVSAEPLLGNLDLGPYLNGESTGRETGGPAGWQPGAALDWVIVGGEASYGAREFDLSWARNIVFDCDEAGATPFVKQLGARPVDSMDVHDGDPPRVVGLKHPKGSDWSEWTDDYLKRREYPKAAA